ncbi:MAG: 3-hydroxyacyl-CoA dehydrogenase NAD-binding domain-containing protein, partial [Spirochaetaceae bacterium]
NVATIHRTEEDGIVTLAFDLPDQKVNKLTTEVMEELDRNISELARRDGVRFLIFKSAKPGVFIAGADINEIKDIENEEDAAAKAGAGQELFNRIEDLPFPTLALINGAAMGGGLELALACDYRIVTENPKTKLGLPETSLGIIPGFGGTQRLPRLIGMSQAATMILTGKPVDARKAEKIRLADARYPEAFAEEWTHGFVDRVLSPGGAAKVRARRKPRSLGQRLLDRTRPGQGLVLRKARKDVVAKTGGHYPAPLEAVKVLRKTRRGSRTRRMRIEREHFGRLAPTPTCKNLINLYFGRESARKHPAMKAELPAPLREAGVLGAGVMGGKIAWLLSNGHIPVVMKDIDWSAVQKGYRSARESYDYLESRRKLDARQVNLKLHKIAGTVSYEDFGDPDVVIEAVVERLDVKKKVLAEVEAHVRPDTIIASNTSALSITEMAFELEHPDRFVGMHFFNPVDRMPLVEVVAGEKSSAEAVGAVGRLAVQLGKTPVFVQNCPGFLVNRLLMPYLNEAVIMAEEGADFTRVDKLLTSFGMPMGPFRLLDEVGIDVGHEVATTLHNAYGDRMQTGTLFNAFKGYDLLLGKKSGRGFYLYAKKPKPNPEMERILSEVRRNAGRGTRGESAARLSDFDLVHRPILNMLNEASRALEERVVESPAELDLALVLGTGFAPFRGGLLRYADGDLGITRIHDLLADYAERFGPRFTPAPLIERLAGVGTGYYQAAEANTLH